VIEVDPGDVIDLDPGEVIDPDTGQVIDPDLPDLGGVLGGSGGLGGGVL
jgi:hypothetical protein